MKIGVFSSPAHTIPHNENRILAPWVLTEQLVDGLIARGHDVTLFAPVGSKTSARLETGGVESCALKRNDFADVDAFYAFVQQQSLKLFRHMTSVVSKFGIEVVHVHQAIDQLYPALADVPMSIPAVCTFHDPITPGRYDTLTKISKFPNIFFISISKAQQKGAQFPFAEVVYNGVDTKLFHPDDVSTQHSLLITGRITPEKGFTDAITAARATGERIMMVGQNFSNVAKTSDYFEGEIRPQIDGKTIFWEPVVKQEHLVGHYQQAKALLFPIHWEEPFGLVMIEAMACGTPVIAYNRGSVPEIIKDGVTGFIVDDINGMVDAIKRIGMIDRAACRKHVEEHFSLEKMVEGYERVYEKIL